MAVNKKHTVAILSEMIENGVNEKDSTTLIAGVGGQRISIHRVILTTNSKYFAALLGPNFEGPNENEFILDETDGPMLKAIVDFCYTGRIDLTHENVSKYLAIASGVELRLLKRKCYRFLDDKLNENTAVATLMIADRFNSHLLRQKAIDFVRESFGILPPSHIDGLDSRLLAEILKSDGFDAEEQVIFERVLSWFHEDQDERVQHISGLLKLIRLPLIPTKYFNGNTIQTIYKKFGCFDYLYAELKRRISRPTWNAGTRRRRTIYCLLKQRNDDADSQSSAVKIGRYNSALNEFEGVGEIELGQLRRFGATFHENKVYILGGEINHVTQKSVLVFDLASGEKRFLPEMSSAHNHSDPFLVGKFIYMFGGRDGRTTLASCERFDLETETWETLKPMNVARNGVAVAELNGYIYVAGGYNDQSRFLKDIELFDPQNDEWITLAPILDARFNCKLLASKNYLYVMGDAASIERYDPLTNRRTKIGSIDSCKNIVSSVVVNDSIYVIRKNGEFDEMKIDENGGCSFVSIVKSEYVGQNWTRLFLFCN